MVEVLLLIDGQSQDRPVVLRARWFEDRVPLFAAGQTWRDPSFRFQATVAVAQETAARLVDTAGDTTYHPRGWLLWEYRPRRSERTHHREDGPYLVAVAEDGTATERWYHNGWHGRADDAPSLTVRRRDGSTIEAFYRDGMIDRDRALGPAVIVHHPDGRRTETFVEHCRPVPSPDGLGPRRLTTREGALSAIPIAVWFDQVREQDGDGDWRTYRVCRASDEDAYELPMRDVSVVEADGSGVLAD
jgi:hypothetical protein